jgi:hypothetical protein
MKFGTNIMPLKTSSLKMKHRWKHDAMKTTPSENWAKHHALKATLRHAAQGHSTYILPLKDFSFKIKHRKEAMYLKATPPGH